MDACNSGKGTCVDDMLSGILLIRAVLYARPANKLRELACSVRRTAVAPSRGFVMDRLMAQGITRVM